MHATLSILCAAAVVFASTNVDDVFVLLSYFADPAFKTRHIVIGQYVGITTLYAASVLGSLISLEIAPQYVGFLGVVPILIGLKRWLELSRGSDEFPSSSTHWSNAKVLSVAAMTVANGFDNVGVYIPFFATLAPAQVALVGIVFLFLTALWIVGVHWMTNHAILGGPIRRYGRQFVPFILIGLGFVIIFEAGALRLLSEAHRIAENVLSGFLR